MSPLFRSWAAGIATGSGATLLVLSFVPLDGVRVAVIVIAALVLALAVAVFAWPAP